MAEEFQVPMHQMRLTRHLFLSVEGIKTEFLVNTSCIYTVVSLAQAKALGVEGKLVPVEGGWLVFVTFTLGSRSFLYPVIVDEHTPFNILGLNIMQLYCCVIDFAENKFTFRKESRRVLPQIIRRLIEINGYGVLVDLDTGANVAAYGPTSVAKELRLPLSDVGNQNLITIGCENHKCNIKSAQVRIRGFGREVFGQFTGYPDSSFINVGMPLLEGLRFEFNSDGTCTIEDGRLEKAVASLSLDDKEEFPAFGSSFRP